MLYSYSHEASVHMPHIKCVDDVMYRCSAGCMALSFCLNFSARMLYLKHCFIHSYIHNAAITLGWNEVRSFNQNYSIAPQHFNIFQACDYHCSICAATMC